MKPVQMGIKTAAIGSGLAVLGYVLTRLTRYARGPEDACVNVVAAHIDRSLVEELFLMDADSVNLLNRLEMFQRFDKLYYKLLFTALYDASKIKQAAYSKKEMNATDSFSIRKSYQAVIECVRIFRNHLEKLIPSSLEDFDEIAADINAKVEQECTDAIQDTFVN
jgi:hypothetical protein